MTTPTTTFACPGCGIPTAVGTTRCARCRIRLVGELAQQLWHLDQQLGSLRARRDVLVARLRSDDDVLPDIAASGAHGSPGTETRRALLVLGAVCLIAALTAGTALIWPALGVAGQTAVLLLITGGLLAAAVGLQHRLPATAEAVAAVAVAATAVDMVAGRRLVAPGLAGVAARSYWTFGAVAALAVLSFAAARARRLHSPTVGAVGAAFAVVVAVVEPRTLGGLAVVGLTGTCLGLGIARFAGRLPLSRAAAATTALVGGAVFAVVCLGAAFLDTPALRVPFACGLLVCGVIAMLTDLLGVARDGVLRRIAAAAGGVIVTALLIASQVIQLGDWALLTAGVAAALLFVLAVPAAPRLHVTASTFVGAGAVLAEVCAQASLQVHIVDPTGMSRAAAGLGVITLVFAVVALLAYPHRLDVAAVAAAGATAALTIAVFEGAGVHGAMAAADALSVVAAVVFAVAACVAAVATRPPAVVAAAVGVPAGLATAAAVDLALALRHVSTVEAYVVAPGAVAFVSGVIAMRRLPWLSSWALAPGFVVSMLPTLLLAWRGDLGRQVAMLVIGAALVAIGAQWRLASPLASGAVAVTTVVLRVLGPQVAELPRWLTLGVLGAALLVLGSTWERRLQEVHRVADRVRPSVAALR